MEALTTHTFYVEQPEPGREAAPAAAFAVSYNGKIISGPLAAQLLSITYTDKTAGEADELEIEIEDSNGNWRRGWYPDKGATLVARIGWPGKLLSCGEFEVDEVAQTGPPSVVSIRGLAAGLTKSVRTKRSKAFENQTLGQIAGHFAKQHGLTIVGNIRPVTIERCTQSQSRDLKFLKKLAKEYGYVFSLRGKQLVFTDIYSLEGSNPVVTLNEADIVSYSFIDKRTDTYEGAELRYHNPKHRRTIKARHAAGTSDTSGDTLIVRRKSENQTQATAQAKAALHWANRRSTECSITLEGRPEIVAGVVVRLSAEFGRVGGLYYVETSTHRVGRGTGYETSFNGKRVSK